MGSGKKIWMGALAAVLCMSAHAQDAKQIVQLAVNAELAANRDDNSHWRYLKHMGGGNSEIVVETEHGAISRHVEEGGKPASAATLRADDEHIQKFIHDPGMQAKQRKDGAHDDKDATELLNLMPEAFLWKVESETQETWTLSFKPNSSFHPPDMEARVMGEMAGTLIVNKAQHRIHTYKGALTEDVTIGFGIFARLKQGGSFDIEHRQVVPKMWQITETHVHIEGRALFFKTIGQQQDEVKTDFTLVPLGTTLDQAVVLLSAPAAVARR
jgi:hypothetical protein